MLLNPSAHKALILAGCLSYFLFPVNARGSNLVFNSVFDIGSAPVSFTGSQHGPTSAAAGWSIFNNGLTTTYTEICFLTCPSDAPPPPPLNGTIVPTVHIVTGTPESGIYEFLSPFNTGPDKTLDGAWVYVLRGGAELGAGHRGVGGPFPDVSTSLTDQWVHLQSFNGQSPVNEVILYSYSGPSDFFGAQASVDPEAAQGTPEPGTIFTGALVMMLLLIQPLVKPQSARAEDRHPDQG